MALTADRVLEILDLAPLPLEGGYYRETYRASLTIPGLASPGGGPRGRRAGTAIYYMLTPETCSVLHRLKGDEVFHFYLGDPVEMLLLHPGGEGETVTLGSDILGGMRLQVVVPAGVWQGSRLKRGGSFALMGTTMTPGFEFEDFQAGSRTRLTSDYPAFADVIRTLTRG